jgi:hypothetical protein
MNRDYVNLLSMCLKSMDKYGNKPEDTDVLVFTCEDLKPDVETAIRKLSFPVRIYTIKSITTVRDALGERLKIFESIDCFQYERILYLDSDILIGNSVEPLFKTPLKNDTVYAMKEGTLNDRWFCQEFFDFTKVDGSISSVNSGIYLFKPSNKLKTVFTLMYADFKSDRVPNAFTDQSYFAYHLFINKCYDNEFLTPLISYGFKNEDNPRKPLYHFIGPYVGGGAEKRLEMMDVFHNKLGKTDKV